MLLRKISYRLQLKMLLICTPFLVVAQDANLIPNESFEQRDSLAVLGVPVPCPNSSGGINLCAQWGSSAGSIDYYHACATNSDYPDYGVPNNVRGYQEAKEGEAYALFAVFSEGGGENWREYIEVELKEPLNSNKVYRLSFFLNLPDERKYAVSEIGALLTKESTSDYSGTDYFNAKPQVVNHKDSILNDKEEWMEITDTFTVDGDEKFLTIGCFEPYSNLTIESTYDSVGQYTPGCAYFLDVVTLTEVGTVGIGDAEQVITNIYPNPVNDVFLYLEHSVADTRSLTWQLLDLQGRVLLTEGQLSANGTTRMDVSSLASGVYLSQLVKQGRTVSTQKVVVR